MSKFILCIAMSFLMTGCTANSPQPEVKTENGYQRFVPVDTATFGGGLALDTKTGQLCRTWDLHLNFEVIGSTPLCKTLYDADQPKK